MSAKMRIGILKPGSTFEGMIARFGDYDAWFGAALAPTGARWDAWDTRTGSLPDPGEADGWIITGARSSVADQDPAVDRLLGWIREAIDREVPLLGVCYGHQAVCAAVGGRVERSANGWELGTVTVELTEAGRADPLFDGFPSRFPVQTTHQDAVVALPPGVTLLARNDHSEAQAVAIGASCRGVQFHPEVTEAIAHDFVERRGQEAGGKSVVAPAPFGSLVLARFVDRFVAA